MTRVKDTGEQVFSIAKIHFHILLSTKFVSFHKYYQSITLWQPDSQRISESASDYLVSVTGSLAGLASQSIDPGDQIWF